MSMVTAKTMRFKSNLETGDLTFQEMVNLADEESISAGRISTLKFEDSLRYDLTRTVSNIFGNATIKYNSQSNAFCLSLQSNLDNIFFKLYQYGKCYLKLNDKGAIILVATTKEKGYVELIDKAYSISNITQRDAVDKALILYGTVTNCIYSSIAERGVMGVFSPQKDTVIKASQSSKIYNAFRTLFGAKTGQRKFAMLEVPMNYTGVTLPIKDMELIDNKKDATATAARIFGIQEDMILSGSTFDNKENAIIQTYTDYKGLIYNYISQIERQKISIGINLELYDVSFPSVPQMNKTNTETNG